MAHSTSPNVKKPDLVRATKSAKRCMAKILSTLDLRRSLFPRATRWVLPTSATVERIPNADAAQQIGYAGAMLDGSRLLYFQGLWSEEMRQRRVNIAVLEAWTVVMTAATWGPVMNCRKVVFRTDSGATCACLNRLWSGSDEMQIVCDLWEDMQHTYCFEGLVLHCRGEDNRLSDVGSRCKRDGEVDGAMRKELRALGMDGVEPMRVPVEWRVGEINIDISPLLLQ
jgi:hypothetical protein